MRTRDPSADVEILSPCILRGDELAICLTADDLRSRSIEMAARWDAAARTAFRQSRKDGRAEGQDAGVAEVLGNYRLYRGDVSAMRQAFEAALNELVLDACGRVLAELPPADLIAGAVARAMADVQPTGRAVLHVHGDAVQALTPRLAPLDLTVLADSTVAPGTARLETEGGVIDLSLARHLHMLETILAGDSP
ncbi:MAG: FliH/SctL family protein [Pseudomonadota bacterium]